MSSFILCSHSWVHVFHLPGEEMAPGLEEDKLTEDDALANVLLRNLGSWHSCYLDYIPPIKILLPSKYSPSWQQYSTMAVTSFSRIIHHTANIIHEWFEEHEDQEGQGVDKVWVVLDKLHSSMVVPLCSLQDLKDMMLEYWWQILQHINPCLNMLAAQGLVQWTVLMC